jgi:hypothetical protein
VLPPAEGIDPAGQTEQAASPGMECFPGSHCEQLVPAAVGTEPPIQLEHLAQPLSEYLPGLQDTHPLMSAPDAYFPATQDTQKL